MVNNNTYDKVATCQQRALFEVIYMHRASCLKRSYNHCCTVPLRALMYNDLGSTLRRVLTCLQRRLSDAANRVYCWAIQIIGRSYLCAKATAVYVNFNRTYTSSLLRLQSPALLLCRARMVLLYAF
jgi:hypothetical protein